MIVILRTGTGHIVQRVPSAGPTRAGQPAVAATSRRQRQQPGGRRRRRLPGHSVSGTRQPVSQRHPGLLLVDVSTPVQPVRVGRRRQPSAVHDSRPASCSRVPAHSSQPTDRTHAFLYDASRLETSRYYWLVE